MGTGLTCRWRLLRGCVAAAVVVSGLLLARGAALAQIVFTNLVYSGALAQVGSVSNFVPVHYDGNALLQSLTNSSSAQLSNITASGTAELTYLTVTPGFVRVGSRVFLSGSLPLTSNTTARTAGAGCGATFSLAFVSLTPARYNLNLTATVPPSSESVNLSNQTFSSFSRVMQYNLIVDGVYVLQTNLPAPSGTYTLANDVLANHVLSLLPAGGLSLNLLDASGGPLSVSRSLNFDATITLPALNAGRVGALLVLSWPTNFTTYALETSTNVNNPGGWSAVTSGIITSNGLNVLTVPLGGPGGGYYRLKK